MEKANNFVQEQVGLQPFDAIQLNHFTRVRYFLKNGLNANLRDDQKRTLLMCCCNLVDERTALKFINLLLKNKARIELTDIDGLSALHYAVLAEHKQVVARFLQFSGNFDLNYQDNEGNTALMLAVLSKNFAIAEQIIHALRKYDLSVDISNNLGITPLIQATILGQGELAKCLIVVGKASKQIRDKHFQKSASEWERTRGQLCGRYSTSNRDIHTSPPQALRMGRGRGEMSTMQDSPDKVIGVERASTELYRWPDLKRAYTLYEPQLTSSYRKSAPPWVKAPLLSSPTTSAGAVTWRKTVQSLRMKQRRHTMQGLALSRSLPNNLSSKLLSSRRSIPDGCPTGRSFSIGAVENGDGLDNSRWSLLHQQYSRRDSLNSLRRSYDVAPSTAPGILESSVLSTECQKKRRNSTSLENLHRRPRRASVSFQLSIEQSDDTAKSILPIQPREMRRSSLKYDERGSRDFAETRVPIFEHEEDMTRNDDDRDQS